MALFKSLFGSKEGKFVEVAPFGSRYEVPSGETMLEAALKNGVPFPHNCTVGTCGSCKCKLKTGRVSALTDFGYMLSQQEIAAGFILACQAIPKDPLTQVEVEAQSQDLAQAEKFVGKIGARPLWMKLPRSITTSTCMSFRKNSYVALFDACVLFSPGLMSLAINLARTGALNVRGLTKNTDGS